MDKLIFNTGRTYSAEGQVIHARNLGDGRVHFVDLTRYIDGVVCCSFNEAAILRAYDLGEYDCNYRDINEQLELMAAAQAVRREHGE
jgi:hypothetical protein